MRCHVCDQVLSDAEVVFNKELNAYEPCFTCLEVALEAAYSGGFTEDGAPFGELDEDGPGFVEPLEADFDEWNGLDEFEEGEYD